MILIEFHNAFVESFYGCGEFAGEVLRQAIPYFVVIPFLVFVTAFVATVFSFLYFVFVDWLKGRREHD